MAKDPVCNMEVDERSAEFKSHYARKTYYFCSEECKNQFESSPEQYATAA
jgi:YHS domain-containing protein